MGKKNSKSDNSKSGSGKYDVDNDRHDDQYCRPKSDNEKNGGSGWPGGSRGGYTDQRKGG